MCVLSWTMRLFAPCGTLHGMADVKPVREATITAETGRIVRRQFNFSFLGNINKRLGRQFSVQEAADESLFQCVIDR